MKKFVHRQLYKNDKLLAHSLVILVGSMLVNGLNYLYQLVMGRLLGPVEYGVLGALFAMMYIVMFSFGTVRTVAAKFTSKFYAMKDFSRIRRLLTRGMFTLFFYGGMGYVALYVLAPVLSSYLNIDNVSLLALTGGALFFALLLPLPVGILNGLERFYSLMYAGLAGALMKLGFGVVAVVLGYGVFGAMLALNVSGFLTVVIAILLLLPLFKYKSKKLSKAELFSYSFPVFIGFTLINLFVNVDVLMVKHYFPNLEAGYYVAASVLAKMIWFASAALIWAMFPKAAKLKSQGKDSSKILKSMLFYIIILSVVAVSIYFIVPTFISTLLFGSEYKIAEYVGMFGLVLGFFSLSSALVQYNLAVDNTWFVYLLTPLILVEIGGIWAFHSTLFVVLQVLLVTNILLTAFMLFVSRKDLGFNTI